MIGQCGPISRRQSLKKQGVALRQRRRARHTVALFPQLAFDVWRVLPGERRNTPHDDGTRGGTVTTGTALGPATRSQQQLRSITPLCGRAAPQTRHVLREKIDLPVIAQMLGISKMLHAQVLALAAAKTL